MGARPMARRPSVFDETCAKKHWWILLFDMVYLIIEACRLGKGGIEWKR